MKKLLAWLDHRTGYRKAVHEALYENIPGGSRWRYAWGSTLVFTFVVQVITGIFLWMAYSASTQTAWESVYYIEHEMAGGSLLRGIHHYAAQLMVILLVLHLLQVVIDGAYKAPREVNFWLGLVLMQIVLGLALTGYLLPWDQKGYWATQVATKIAATVPLVGESLQELIIGGKEYGHHTVTRFFALHAGLLPALLVGVLFLHLSLFRRHGITAKDPDKRPAQFFWPEQVLKDGIASLVVLIAVVVLAALFKAELGAPADPAEAYSAARPEWYFLFLFQFLKFFPGETGEFVGAVVLPGAVMLVFFLMPFVGRHKVGHRFNLTFLLAIVLGAGVLTGLALNEDYRAKWVAEDEYDDVQQVLAAIDVDLRKSGTNSPYFGKSEEQRIEAYFKPREDEGNAAEFFRRLADYRAYQKSQEHIAATDQAERNAERARELAGEGIPPAGALELMHNDPKTAGPKLFRQYCASCHDHVDPRGNGISQLRPLTYPTDQDGNPLTDQPPVPGGAPNLYGFAGRDWLRGFLDPEKITAHAMDTETYQIRDAPYFGNTRHRAEREDEGMAWYVKAHLAELDDEGKKALEKIIVTLSAEAGLKSQKDVDEQARAAGLVDDVKANTATLSTALGDYSCIDCHAFHGEGTDAAPDLTGYGSEKWLKDFISNPAANHFYGSTNDRMPVFRDPADENKHLMTERELDILVKWLRGEWYEPDDNP